MKSEILSFAIIGLAFLVFGGESGCEAGPESELEKIIARDPEVMLFAVQDEQDHHMRAYTLSKEKLNQLQSVHFGVDEGSEKVDLHRIVKNCDTYLRQDLLKHGDTNEYKFVSIEIMTRKIVTNDVYYAKVEFSRYCSDWAVVEARRLPIVIVYALLDGEVLQPKQNEYTKYIDAELAKQAKCKPKSNGDGLMGQGNPSKASSGISKVIEY